MNFVYLPPKRAAIEQTYASTVEYHNIEQLYRRCSLLRRPFRWDLDDNLAVTIKIGSSGIYVISKDLMAKETLPDPVAGELLKLQIAMKFPIFLHEDDCRILLYQAFGGFLTEPLTKLYCAPPDLNFRRQLVAAYTEWDSVRGKALVYSTLFESHANPNDTIALQVLSTLSRETSFYINISALDIEVKTPLPKEMATELFKSWYAYLRGSEGYRDTNRETTWTYERRLVNLSAIPDEVLSRIISFSVAKARLCIVTTNDFFSDPRYNDWDWSDSKLCKSQAHNKSTLRLISKRFCQIIDNTVPCFAFLKMIKEEVKRVKQSKEGLIESPWLTQDELELIVNERQLNLNEPHPPPSLIPLSALAIVANSTLLGIRHSTANCQVTFIFATARHRFFTITINDKKSPFNGKAISVIQQDFSRDGDCPCCLRTLKSEQVIITDDVEVATFLGIPKGEPFSISKIDEERAQELFRFCPWISKSLRTLLENNATNVVPKLRIGEDPLCIRNEHYLGGTELWNQLPTLPPCVYHLLTGATQNRQARISQLNALCHMIDRIQLNLIYLPHFRPSLEQLYSANLERHNIEPLYKRISVLRRPTACTRTGAVAFTKGRSYCQRFGMASLPSIDELGVSLLHLQNSLQLPIFLSNSDLMDMLHLMLGGTIIGMMRRYLPPPTIDSLSELQLKPLCPIEGLKIHTSTCDTRKEDVIYYVSLLCGANHAIVQVLRKDSSNGPTFYFHVNLATQTVESIQQCDEETAIELFEYWYGYLCHYGGYVREVLTGCSYCSTYLQLLQFDAIP